MTNTQASTPDDSFIGSQLPVSIDYLETFTSWLYGSTQPSLQNDDWLAAHNIFTIYTSMLLSFCSGHRAVKDPFHDIDGIDLDTGLAIISDKVIEETREWRLVCLPESACKQVQLYIHHLEALAVRVNSRNPKLATEILATTLPGREHPLPFFFLLSDELRVEHIQPAVLEATFGENWIYPMNTNRHLLASYLLRNGCIPEHVEAQLGHIESGCDPFGPYSVFSPETLSQTLASPLESYLSEIGWKVIGGLTHHRGRGLPSIRARLSTVSKGPKFGPELRKEKRLINWRNDSAFVKGLVDEALVEDKKELGAEAVTRLIDSLVENDGRSAYRFVIRYELLRRHLNSVRHKGVKLTLPGRLAKQGQGPSPFHGKSLLQSKDIELYRQRFAATLTQRGKAGDHQPLERRIAEILVSAVLNGALLYNRALENLPNSLLTGLFQYEGIVWIDIVLDAEMTDSPLRRWIPDQLSTALLVGWSQQRKGLTNSEFNAKLVHEELSQLLNELGIKIKLAKKDKKNVIAKLLAPLVKISKEAWQLTLPSFLSSYATGDHLAPSLRPNAWYRLISGQRIATEPDASSNAPSLNEHDSNIVEIRPSTKTTHAKSRAFSNELRSIVNQQSDTKGNKRKGAVKKHIATQIKWLQNKYKSDMCVIDACLAGWALHLCISGTNNKSDIAASTIKKYLFAIGPILTEYAYGLDFLTLDDLDYTNIYSLVMDSSSHTKKRLTLRCLKHFHSYLARFDVCDVDWDEIYSDGTDELQSIDAGLITHPEYTQAFNLLLGEKEPYNWQQLTSAIYLMLSYHFGLRKGELDRLRLHDIQFDAHDLNLIIRSTDKGDVKSDNSFRHIPMLDAYNDHELQAIQLWFNHLITKEHPLDEPIFATRIGNLCSANPYKTVIEALRAVSGDNNIRHRHLRHTYATRLTLALSSDSIKSSHISRYFKQFGVLKQPEEYRRFILGRPEPSRRVLYAISGLMGHGRPSMGLKHYIHSLDVLLGECVLQVHPKIADIGLAYAYAIKPNYLRVQRSRALHKPDHRSTALLTHHLPSISIKLSDEPPDLLIHKVSTTQLNLPDIDRLLFMASRWKGTVETLADKFLADTHMVSRLIRSAISLQIETGYTGFQLPEPWLQIPLQHNSSTFLKEHKRARKSLSKVNNIINQDDEASLIKLLRIVEIWAPAYHADALLFSDAEILNSFYRDLDIIGLLPSDTELLTSRDDEVTADMISEFTSISGNYDVAVREVSSLPRFLHKTKSRRISRVGVSLITGTTPYAYQRTLNRVLFVLTAWTRAHAPARELN